MAIDAMKKRCAWCGDDPLYVAYHDTEWGVPKHDDPTLFEFLVLEGAQASLGLPYYASGMATVNCSTTSMPKESPITVMRSWMNGYKIRK